MKRISAALGLVFLSLQHTTAVLACAVCGSGANDPTTPAYTHSTAFLSVVPLVAIGSVVYTVYRYAKNAENE